MLNKQNCLHLHELLSMIAFVTEKRDEADGNSVVTDLASTRSEI